jgi:hypothetical protein
MTLDKAETAKNLKAKVTLPSVIYQKLGKGFVECPFDTRQIKVAMTVQ